MLKRSHVLLPIGLVAVVSGDFLCGADDQGQEAITFTKLQSIKVAANVVALSPSGNRLAVSLDSDDHTIILYEKNKAGQYKAERSHSIKNFKANNIVLHPDDDSDQFACWGYTWLSTTKDIGTSESYFITSHQFKLLHSDPVSDGAYNSEGSQFASLRYHKLPGHKLYRQKISIWNTENKQLLREFDDFKIRDDFQIWFDAIQYHNDSNILMALGNNRVPRPCITYAINTDEMEINLVRVFDPKFKDALITINGNVVLSTKKPVGHKDEVYEYNIQLASACDLLYKKDITVVEENLYNLICLDDSGPGPPYLYAGCNGPSVGVWRLEEKEKKKETPKAGLIWDPHATLSKDGRVLVGVDTHKLTIYEVIKAAIGTVNNGNLRNE